MKVFHDTERKLDGKIYRDLDEREPGLPRKLLNTGYSGDFAKVLLRDLLSNTGYLGNFTKDLLKRLSRELFTKSPWDFPETQLFLSPEPGKSGKLLLLSVCGTPLAQ